MKVAVIGAGPAGITAAYQLAGRGVEVEVFEAADDVGGMCRSIQLWDQTVDLGPHRFFSGDERVNRLWQEVVGEDYHLVERLTRIYYRQRFYHYPLRPGNALWNMGLGEAARCVLSYLRQKAARPSAAEDDRTFESWVVGRFGRRLFEMFFKSYSEKLWGIPCNELDADFAAQRIKKFSLGEAVKNALGFGGSGHKTLVDQFAYPVAGTGMVYRRMADAVAQRGGRIHLRRPVRRVLHKHHRVCGIELEDGTQRACDWVISTMPLTLLVKGLGDLSPHVREAVERLTFRNTVLVYLHVDGTELFDDQWLYVHAPELAAGRITNFRNWVPELYGNAATTIVAMEYWCNDGDPLWSQADARLIDRARAEIETTGLLGGREVLDGRVLRIHRAYPVYRRGYRQHLDRVTRLLDQFSGLIPIGRYGAFKYNNQDHSILMGILAAENVLGGQQTDLMAVNTDYDTYQESAPLIDVGLTGSPPAATPM